MNNFNIKRFLLIICWLSIGQLPSIDAAQAAPKRLVAQANKVNLKIVVNSDRDTIQSDNALTLREAISLLNGELKLDKLSTEERAQVREGSSGEGSRIEFNLPAGATKINLDRELPPIQMVGVTIDGTTQPGFVPKSKSNNAVVMATPVVEITPAKDVQISRGISILADDVTVKGLSIYGFSIATNATQDVPGGDIFVSHRLPPPDISEQQAPGADSAFGERNLAPKNVTIEGNFLGVKPDKSIPPVASNFGVYVFNSKGTTIRNNVINDHTASGIITSVKADNLLVQENVIVGNGTSGMPDAIRLEGEIRNNKIESNLICGNDGSGVFLFKPAAGAVEIRNNTIGFNGRRLRRAAIHLMGNDNQVTNNRIFNQAGAGVSITAFPQPHSSIGDVASARNTVQNNRFSFLEGLSVDLNTYRNDAVEGFQDGDGINPQRNSDNRRLDTANMAINAPQFRSPDFLLLNDRVNVDGTADPGTKIELYQVSEASTNGPLNRSLATVTADAKGHFGASLTGLKPGEMVSAIATDPKYGTSEPSRNALVIEPGTSAADTKPAQMSLASIPKPDCLSGVFAVPEIANVDPLPPVVAQTPTEITPTVPEIPTPPAEPPAPLKLNIPANVHFALDKSNIAPNSGKLIREIARILKENPYIVVDLQGHTDPRASDDYNQRLGMRRARSTRDYLVRQGISPSRITIRSFGEAKLKSPNNNITDYARDRRVEFIYRDVRGLNLEVIEQENDLQLEQRRK
jgi:outer membrane protein OmpA-like peptidoglycan-associated protein